MKAWKCWEDWEGCGTIIFAETAGKARYIAMCSDSIGDDLEFKDVYVRRMKQMDQYYRGKQEMDWFDDSDRIAMVRDAGFGCNDDYYDSEGCSRCPATEWCSTYERMNR